MIGDGPAEIFKMMLPYAKNIAPKVLTTLGLSGISAVTSISINKALNKNKKRKILLLN